jgi:hypothetical protein
MVSIDTRQVATQTDLDKFLTFFQENLRVFQENSVANF